MMDDLLLPVSDNAMSGEQGFPVGVDYYPVDDERQPRTEWYNRDVQTDFAAMAAAGITLVRIFVSWKVMEPQVGQYNTDAENRLGEIMVAARSHDMRLIVTFFADDCLTGMNDVVWGRTRDPHTDDYLIARQVSLVQRIVNHYRTETAVWAWELGNEAFISGFETGEDLQGWAELLRDAIREVDVARAVILGADPETLMRESGVDARTAIGRFEYSVSHVTAPYRAYAAEGPPTYGLATYLDSFLLHSALRSLPVLSGGIGASSLDFSPAEEAALTRVALYSALMNRASGAILGRWRDCFTKHREPYFSNPFEVLVGLNDPSGAPKPVLDEVRRFAQIVTQLDLRKYMLVPEQVAVLVPAERYEPLPSLSGLSAPRSCLQAYVTAKEAHLPVALVHEGDEIGGYQALFVPSISKLLPVTWRRLATFVQSGGSVVFSYGGGDVDPAVREVFGVEFLGDDGARTLMNCRIAQPGLLGDLSAFDVQLELPNFALLGGLGATVVATDQTGNPLVTFCQHGKGRAVFVAAPLERAIAQSDPWAVPGQVRALLRTVYGAVARAAGASGLIDCAKATVEIARFSSADGDVVIVLNHEPVAVTATLISARTIADAEDLSGNGVLRVGAHDFPVPLGPNGAAVLKLSYG